MLVGLDGNDIDVALAASGASRKNFVFQGFSPYRNSRLSGDWFVNGLLIYPLGSAKEVLEFVCPFHS
jgi:hypothetical protein